MSLRSVATGVVGLVASSCAFQPWTAHSKVVTKPTPHVRASPDRARIVVVLNGAIPFGGGELTVFDEGLRPWAQFPEEAGGWSYVDVAPGHRRAFARTWSSDYCHAFEGTFAAGKVYVLLLVPVPLGLSASWKHLAQDPDPGGPLLYWPYFEMNTSEAASEVTAHADAARECMDSRNSGYGTLSSDVARERDGYDVVGVDEAVTR